MFQGLAHAQHGWQSGRIKADGDIKLTFRYSDNIFHNNNEKKSDFITHVQPQAKLSYAIAHDNILSAMYRGDFQHHKNYDNFPTQGNYGTFAWQLMQPRGSRFEAGFILDDASIQPYSEKGEARDYFEWQAYIDVLLKIGAFTESGLKLKRSSREFDENLWKIDNYDRYGLTWHLGYQKWAFTSLIFNYTYSHQENNDVKAVSLDMDVHTILAGLRWEPGRRLYGRLQGGYSRISGDGFPGSSSFALNADLGYTYSDFTRFKLTAYRRFNPSTRAERETNVYNASTGGKFTTDYSRWDQLRFILDFKYENQVFEGGYYVSEKRRNDNFYLGSVKARYAIRQWLSLELQYRYRERDSNLMSVEYEENTAAFWIKFTL